MKKYWRIVSFSCLMPCFFCLNIVFANTSVREVKIPAQFGNTREVFSAQNSSSGCTIIQIQDAHCNYEAQKNLAQMLEYLINEYKLRLIFVEGGNGNVNLSFLRTYADKKAREEVADSYLKAGKISGEEYLDIVSDIDFELYGIEDEALYDRNMDAFLKLDSFREKGLQNLENLRFMAEKLKPYIYKLELSEFERKINDYAEKLVSLVDYCRYLKELADKKGIDLKDYRHLVAFVEGARLEKAIDFKAAETQRNAFIGELGKLLDENSLQELLSKSQDFKAGKITPDEYYTYLSFLAKHRIEIRKNYPQLAFYIDYITVGKNIDANDLLKEIPFVEDKLKSLLAVGEEEKRLVKISESLNFVAKYLKLDLTPEEYKKLEVSKPDLDTASWFDFLTQNCQKYNLPVKQYVASAVDNNFVKLDEFYKLGLDREKSFIKNIEAKMISSKDKLAVLITGGFHTPGVSQLLKEKGYSYMVVTPVITKQSDSSLYFSVLREKKSRLPEEYESPEVETTDSD